MAKSGKDVYNPVDKVAEREYIAGLLRKIEYLEGMLDEVQAEYSRQRADLRLAINAVERLGRRLKTKPYEDERLRKKK